MTAVIVVGCFKLRSSLAPTVWVEVEALQNWQHVFFNSAALVFARDAPGAINQKLIMYRHNEYLD